MWHAVRLCIECFIWLADVTSISGTRCVPGDSFILWRKQHDTHVH